MARTRGTLAILILGLGIPAALLAQKPGSSNTSVTSLISDYDSGVDPALQIQSDTLGAYRNSSTLTSVIGTDGTWAVDSYYVQKATRRIYLNFSQPIATTGPGGWDSYAWLLLS